VIEKFEVRNEDVPSAVASLANEHAVLCGIAVVPYPQHTGPALVQAPFKRVTLAVSHVKVRELLNRLVALDPAFEWREREGVVNVALRGTFKNPAHPLNRVIPHFAVHDVPYPFALYGDWQGEMRGLFRLEWASGLPMMGVGSGPPPSEYPPVTVDARDNTALLILNDMARQLRLS
jgi:hypothetical protein